MQMKQMIGHAPRTHALASELSAQQGLCIGCVGCQGICQALLDAMSVPDVILKDRRA